MTLHIYKKKKLFKTLCANI